MEDTARLVLLVVVCLVFVGLFLFTTVYLLADTIEKAWFSIFKKPLYVHFYPVKKDLAYQYEDILIQHFTFYNNLSHRHKKYFKHRVAKFIKRYKIHGREGLEVTPEIKVTIAATWVMLTFGMRKYLPHIFQDIILYPDVYQSVTGNWHKGEFNYPANVVIFSWKHFLQGVLGGAGNINLGLHEFAHVLHVYATDTDEAGAWGDLYAKMYNNVVDYLNHGQNREALLEVGYLRDYAFTNNAEFMAVMLECFFETPDDFRVKMPELYNMAATMINYRP